MLPAPLRALPLVLLLLAGILLAPWGASAQQHRRAQSVDSFDIQQALRGTTLSGIPARAGTVARHPDLVLRWDALTGLASRVTRTDGPLTAPAALDAETVLRSFVAGAPQLYGQSAPEVGSLRVRRRYDSPGLDVTHVWLGQELHGIPVFKAELKGDVTFRGELLATSGTLVPNLSRIAPAALPRLSAAQALLLAAGHCGVTAQAAPVALTRPTGARQRVIFDGGEISSEPAAVELAYFQIAPGQVALAWETTLWLRASADVFHVLVDAGTGALLYRRNYTSDAKGLIYDSDAPQDGTPVASSLPPAEQSRVTEVFDGGRLYNGTPLFASGDPHFDWWNGGQQTKTSGNNVEAGSARDQAGSQAGAPVLVSASGGDFSFPLDLSKEPYTYTSASVTNLFYWVNRLHDIWYRYGFTESAGNFQASNLGLGGLQNDPIRALAQFGANTGSKNNATFTAPKDGSRGVMRLFEWDLTSPRRDSDLDAGVIAHEFGHGVSSRLVGNADGLGAFQSRAMGEGWSDFQALVVLAEETDDVNGRYTIGAYLVNDFARGIRSQPYCTNLTENVFTPTFSAVNTTTSIHRAGEVICNALWQVYGRLHARLGFTAGRDRMMQLFIDMLKLLPDEPTFLDCRDRLLLADQTRYRGEDAPEIWAAFASRGMGYSATTMGPDDRNVFQAFDVPYSIRGTVRTESAPVEGVTVSARGPGEDAIARTVSVGVSIPDASSTGITSTLTIPESFTATSVRLTVDILHMTPGNLEIRLTHPDGSVVLVQPQGSNTTDNLRVTYHVVPFAQKNCTGTWSLNVRDMVLGDLGKLVSWGLRLGFAADVTRTAVTGPDGRYLVHTLGAGAYTVTPSRDGFPFSPASSTVTLGPDATADFELIDARMAFSSDTYTANEGESATITVVRPSSTSVASSISYATSNGTAAAPGDYTGASGALVFPEGDASETFRVPTAADLLLEGGETVRLALSQPVGGALGEPGAATLVIADDIAAPAPAAVSLTLSGTSVTVKWTDRCANEERFEVQYSSNGGSTWSAPATASAAAGTGTVKSVTIKGLKRGTTYVFRVRAANSLNQSAYAYSSSLVIKSR